MNGTDNNTDNRTEQGTDALTELFQLASPRQRPPVEEELRVRQALHDNWKGIIRKKRMRRLMWPWSVAALLLLASLIGIGLNPDSRPPVPSRKVAFADKVIGLATVVASAKSAPLQDIPGQELMSGQTVSMGPGSRAALTWVNGAVIRVDERTVLKLQSESDIFLSRGRMYMDTAAADRSQPPVTITTPHGLVQHLGTQFMTRVSSAETAVSVREGEVAYFPSPEHKDERTLARKGQQLAVTANGHIAVQPIRTWGDEWEWAEHLSPGFVADGRSLADLLAWVGRESGRQVRYRSGSAESIAAGTILHGDLDLQPMQALSVATATSDLRAEVDEGQIIVGLIPSP